MCASVSPQRRAQTIQMQPKRVVSVTTMVGNMIFHYTLCKQCNLSVLPIKMIDCGLSRQKSDASEKSFFPTKPRAFRLPQKVVINAFSLGNPTPLANEGGIYHSHRGGRCREDSNPSAWEQFTFFSLIVLEKCDRSGKKKSPLGLTAPRGRHSSAQRLPLQHTNRRHSPPQSITYSVLEALKR